MHAQIFFLAKEAYSLLYICVENFALHWWKPQIV